MSRLPCCFACLLLLAASAHGDQRVIHIDGTFQDWTEVEPAYSDPFGDVSGSAVDLGRIWFADDESFFYIRFETSAVFKLADRDTLTIALDTDLDASTGYVNDGFGAEVVYHFGDLEGRFYPSTTSNPNSGVQIWHSDVGLQGAPTVTSDKYELAFAKDAVIEGTDVFPGSWVRVLFVDDDGENLPDDGLGLTYELGVGSPPAERDEPLGRDHATDVRHMSWNVLRDSPWDSDCTARFGRIIQALNPDILSFQEIYDHSGNQVRSFVDDWIDPDPAGSWHVASNNDCHVVSRHEILVSEAIDGNLAVLVDTSDEFGRPTLIINAHLPCCDNDDGRQSEIDRILRFIRWVRTGQRVEYPSDCALIITGDLNLVGFSQQLESLVEGDIVNEGAYGPDVEPDVDGSDLLDVICFQTEQRLSYTWRNDYGWYWPGRLDFTIISDSVLDVGNRFVVETDAMSTSSLQEYGLLSGDSSCSDHRALVCDLRKSSCTGDLNGDGSIDGADLSIVLGNWGACKVGVSCPPDVDGDGFVGGSDLSIILGFWGLCPGDG